MASKLLVAKSLSQGDFYMFVTSSTYEQVVNSIFAEEEEILAAIAFLGSGAELIFSQPDLKKSVKLICNLRSGATNPSVIDAIQKKGVLIKQNDKLHAKVLFGNKKALVGSANFSSNGLNLEGNEELSGWEEAGLLTSDINQIKSIKNWFDTLWENSRKIEDKDIDEAKLKWKERRSTRLSKKLAKHSTKFSIENFNLSDLLDRRVFLAIYRNNCFSDEAQEAYQTYEENLTEKQQHKSIKIPPMYEWPELPNNAKLIDLHYDPSGVLRCYGVFTRTHDIEFEYCDGSTGILAVCCQEEHLMGYQFGDKEAAYFAKYLKSHINKIWNSELAIGSEYGKYILLADAVKIIKEQTAINA